MTSKTLAIALLVLTKAALAADVDTPESKVGEWLSGKTVHCTNKKGKDTFSLRIIEKHGRLTSKASSTYGNADGSEENTIVGQLEAGNDITMVYVTGRDSDQGGAIVLLNSMDLGDRKEFYGNAQIYRGVPGADFSSRSEALKCGLK